MVCVSFRSGLLAAALTLASPFAVAGAGDDFLSKEQAQNHSIENRMVDMTQQILTEGMKQGAAAEMAKQKRLDKAADSASTMSEDDRGDKADRINAKIESLEKKRDKLERKIEKLESKKSRATNADERERLDEKIEDLEDKKDDLDARIDELEEQARIYE